MTIKPSENCCSADGSAKSHAEIGALSVVIDTIKLTCIGHLITSPSKKAYSLSVSMIVAFPLCGLIDANNTQRASARCLVLSRSLLNCCGELCMFINMRLLRKSIYANLSNTCLCCSKTFGVVQHPEKRHLRARGYKRIGKETPSNTLKHY